MATQFPRPPAAALGALGRLPDSSMRRGAIDAFFAQRAPDEAAAELDALLRRVMIGDPDARQIALDLALWIGETRAPASLVADPTRPRRLRGLAAVRAAATAGEHEAVAAILAEGPAAKSLPRHGRLAEVGLDVEMPLDAFPLFRWSMERTLVMRERLRGHHDARMIRRLLDLRQLRSRDVALVAARRPTSVDIVRAIALSRRWMYVAAVREALVLNPFTPTGIAAPLLPTVDVATLRWLASAGAAAAEVATAARALLALRKNDPPEAAGGAA